MNLVTYASFVRKIISDWFLATSSKAFCFVSLCFRSSVKGQLHMAVSEACFVGKMFCFPIFPLKVVYFFTVYLFSLHAS